jgi:translation initiation factor IF-3
MPVPELGHEGGAAIAAERETRINDRIRAREVRLVGPEGDQLGIKPAPEALAIARSMGLDLVEVAASANPPVCRIMDWGKHRYEQAQRAKEARKRQSQIVVKEMKFRPKIDVHDYETKKRHMIRFLHDGAKVKVTIMFRGREMTHTELGAKILDRLAEDLQEIATVEAPPKLDGRNMVMVVAPRKDLKPLRRGESGDKRAAAGAESASAEDTGAEPAPAAQPTRAAEEA